MQVAEVSLGKDEVQCSEKSLTFKLFEISSAHLHTPRLCHTLVCLRFCSAAKASRLALYSTESVITQYLQYTVVYAPGNERGRPMELFKAEQFSFSSLKVELLFGANHQNFHCALHDMEMKQETCSLLNLEQHSKLVLTPNYAVVMTRSSCQIFKSALGKSSL